PRPSPRPPPAPPASRRRRGSLERHSDARDAGDAERGEAADLGVMLIQEVLDPGREVHGLQVAPALEETVPPADVDTRVTAVVDGAEGLPLLGDDVDLAPERQPLHRLPRQADVPAVARLARQPGVGREVA